MIRADLTGGRRRDRGGAEGSHGRGGRAASVGIQPAGPGLGRREALVEYHHPHVLRLEIAGWPRASVPLDDQRLAAADCVPIASDHASVDDQRVIDPAALVVDTRNATGAVAPWDNVVRL